jgi:tetratricopeptide (TPR) repeat protein
MFFPRLRRHTKWMFVFLALVFGLGFVLFGIGAGGTGVGDIFRNAGGTSGAPSISDARERTEENPKDAEAWRDLSTAYQTEGQAAEAIAALNQYVDLRPKDDAALRELASLYLSRGRERAQAAQLAQYQASFASGGADVLPGLSANGQAVVTDPIAGAVQASRGAVVQDLASEAQDAYNKAVETYRELVVVVPNDPNVQLELAQAAQQAGDAQTAISAYEAFLRLAPDDPNAAIVRQQLRQLRSGS